jgi:CheY-like chemotaxis protein
MTQSESLDSSPDNPPVNVPASSAAQAAQRRILVVDDNRDSVFTLAMLLKLFGNETQTAHDGLEAIDVAAEFRPDVILMDLGMPRLDGYEAARRIRQQPWGQKTVLVALTGWDQEETGPRSREAGFDFYLTKPVNPAALKAMLS